MIRFLLIRKNGEGPRRNQSRLRETIKEDESFRSGLDTG